MLESGKYSQEVIRPLKETGVMEGKKQAFECISDLKLKPGSRLLSPAALTTTILPVTGP